MRFLQQLASLRLAVALIAVLALTLVGATLLESHYGAESRAAYFGIYGLVVRRPDRALGDQCAQRGPGPLPLEKEAYRLPAHAPRPAGPDARPGIEPLCGLDATVAVFETQSSSQAVCDTCHFDLLIQPTPGGSGEAASASAASGTRTVRAAFVGGPFNWSDYRNLSWIPWDASRKSWFPWGWPIAIRA